MTLQLLTIPDDPQAWPQWLTARFSSGQLPLLVQELHLLGGRAADDTSPDLDTILPPQRQQDVADHGLQVLTTDELQHLFARPNTLLQLQGFLCLCGGPIWSALWTDATDPVGIDDTPAAATAASQIWQQALALQVVPVPTGTTVAPKAARNTTWKTRLMLSVTAAMLLLAVFAWRQNATSFSGGVLNAPGLLAADVQSPQEWLDRMAMAGTTWFERHPRNAAELAVLLRQVSRDCELLIQAPPAILAAAPLTPKVPGDPVNQAEWFVAKCRKWQGQFDTTLARLESGQLDFPAAQIEADNTMMKLTTVLRSGPG